MKVFELIEQLQRLPPHGEVGVSIHPKTMKDDCEYQINEEEEEKPFLLRVIAVEFVNAPWERVRFSAELFLDSLL